MLAVANRLKCEVHFATSALTKPSFQPLKILYIQQAFFVSTGRHTGRVELALPYPPNWRYQQGGYEQQAGWQKAKPSFACSLARSLSPALAR